MCYKWLASMLLLSVNKCVEHVTNFVAFLEDKLQMLTFGTFKADLFHQCCDD